MIFFWLPWCTGAGWLGTRSPVKMEKEESWVARSPSSLQLGKGWETKRGTTERGVIVYCLGRIPREIFARNFVRG